MKYDHMPPAINKDVEANLEGSGRKMGDLSEKEYLNAYLEWNGIIGYTDRICTVVQALWPDTIYAAIERAHREYELDEFTVTSIVDQAIDEVYDK